MITTACLACFVALAAAPANEFPPITNLDFTEGDKTPTGWTLSGGQGRWVDRKILEVTGSGKDSNEWRCDYPFVPGALYRFVVRARRTAGSGGIMVGPSFANHDFEPSGDWKTYGYYFRAPDRIDGGYLRLGQWQVAGTLQFNAVILTQALPVHKLVGNIVLGEGEAIRSGRYTFSGTFGGEGGNYHHPLHSATAHFNSDRWCILPGTQVTYRFDLPGCKFRSANASFNVNYYVRGECLAEVSRDGKDWRRLVAHKGLGTAQVALPADLLPAETIYLRLSSKADSYYQVNQIEFQAGLDAAPLDKIGQTFFAQLNPGSKLAFSEMLLMEGLEQARESCGSRY